MKKNLSPFRHLIFIAAILVLTGISFLPVRADGATGADGQQFSNTNSVLPVSIITGGIGGSGGDPGTLIANGVNGGAGGSAVVLINATGASSLLVSCSVTALLFSFLRRRRA